MDDENVVEFRCAYCAKFFKQEVTRLTSGLVIECTGCKKKNHVYVVTYQEAWAQIIGDHPFPEHAINPEK